jgi:hypothetical protein
MQILAAPSALVHQKYHIFLEEHQADYDVPLELGAELSFTRWCFFFLFLFLFS